MMRVCEGRLRRLPQLVYIRISVIMGDSTGVYDKGHNE